MQKVEGSSPFIRFIRFECAGFRRHSWDTPQMPSDRVYTRLSTSSAWALKAFGKLNVPLYRASRGRLFGQIAGTPVLLLTTHRSPLGRSRASRRWSTSPTASA